MKGFVHCVFRFDLAPVLLLVGFNSCSFASWFLFLFLCLLAPFLFMLLVCSSLGFGIHHYLCWLCCLLIPFVVLMFVIAFSQFCCSLSLLLILLLLDASFDSITVTSLLLGVYRGFGLLFKLVLPPFFCFVQVWAGVLEAFSSFNSKFYVSFKKKFHPISKFQSVFLIVEFCFQLLFGFVMCRVNKHTY